MTENTAADRVHAHALVLRDTLLDLHTRAAHPGPAVPGLGAQIASVTTALAEYLADHRDVLGRTDFWHGEYDAMDERRAEADQSPTVPDSSSSD